MFSKKQKLKHSPLERGFYAFNVERAGDFIIYVESKKDYHKFLYVPGAEEFCLTHSDFHDSIRKNILTLVEQLPEEIFNETIMLSRPNKQSIMQFDEKQNTSKNYSND